MRLQLSAHILAQVALTDIRSSWVENALTGLTAGSLVLCRLLEDHEGKRGVGTAARRHGTGPLQSSAGVSVSV